MSTVPDTLTCSHCSKPLAPGRGEFYLVQIVAIADPSPPLIDALATAEIETQIDALLRRLKHTSEEDANTQVFRRVVIYLCYPCYRRWIEDPTNVKAKGLGY